MEGKLVQWTIVASNLKRKQGWKQGLKEQLKGLIMWPQMKDYGRVSQMYMRSVSKREDLDRTWMVKFT